MAGGYVLAAAGPDGVTGLRLAASPAGESPGRGVAGPESVGEGQHRGASGQHANDDDVLFRYEIIDGTYIYNLSTKHLKPGTYVVSALAENGQSRSATFALRK